MIIVTQVTINQMATVATLSAQSFASAGSVLAVERASVKRFSFPIGGFLEVEALNTCMLLEPVLSVVDSPRGPYKFIGCRWLPGFGQWQWHSSRGLFATADWAAARVNAAISEKAAARSAANVAFFLSRGALLAAAAMAALARAWAVAT